jgi:hypothetical protein
VVIKGYFWHTTSLRLLKVEDVSEEHVTSNFRALFDTCFTLVSYLAYFSTLKIEVIYLSEIYVDFHRNYIPENTFLFYF